MRTSLLLLAVACTSCSKSARTPGGPPGSPSGRQGGGAGATRSMGPTPVEVREAILDTVIDAITATGQIEAVQSVELRPDVDGRLVDIFVREGAPVTAGAPLFKVDDAELKAQVARAEAERDLAEQALARTKQLMAEKAAAMADVERAEAAARSARAQLDLLSLRLERTVVRAPWAGVAGARFVSIGDYVTQNSRLITLQTINPQRAAFQVPERYAEQLKVGQTVVFRVAALAGKDFVGRVDFVDPKVELPARTITVKALVPNPKRELQTGMFIEARLETARRDQAVLVPEEAILSLPSGNFIWVAAGDTPERRPVELGTRRPGFVEIRSGIAPGEVVVVAGAERLTPVSKIRVMTRGNPAPSADTAAGKGTSGSR
ncbi:MAG: efflux RND transporter periplasmic adaptor subunit [Gemmatimonadetes bacterium]|nr:efflux RND transporter periplasmic adaptor subunit [Gemmatimonadota bacterium]